MTKTETVLKVLKDNAEKGIVAEELMKACNITKSAAFSAIYGLRQRKFKITTKDFRYFWKSDPPAVVPGAVTPAAPGKQKRAYVRHVPASKPAPVKAGTTSNLPFPLPPGNVPDDKKLQFANLIGEAAYYYRCAEAVITTEKLRTELSN